MKRLISMLALAVALFTSASAFAYDGYVTRSVRLRAGPDSSYPAVARLRGGTSVVIEGCVDDWSWCDVSTRHDRGWVNGNYLQNEYRGRRVLIPRYGVQIGIPIISFVFGSYWDDHYRNRSWYRERDRWSRYTPRYSHGGVRSDSRRGDSRTYTTPSQPRVESRPSGTAPSQPTYQTRPQTTTVAPAPQRAPATPVRTQERTESPSRPPVERSAAEPSAPQQDRQAHQRQPSPAQQDRAEQRQPNAPQQDRSTPQRQPSPPSQERQNAEHQTMAPAREAQPRQVPEQAKSPPAQAAGSDRGRNQGDKGQGQRQDQNKDGDKVKGKDKEKDKEKDKDGGGS